jgi:KUP system potassium uptake protein
VGLVLLFQSSSNLAATYGVAVSGTMLVTSILFAVVARDRWQWPLWQVLALAIPFVLVDLAFLSVNMLKVVHGGWFPIAVAGVAFLLMSTWKVGRRRLSAIVRENTLPFDLFLPDLARRTPPRVPGSAVFLTSEPTGAPPVLLHHLKHNKVLHERVIILSMVGDEIPQVPDADRVTCESLGQGFYLVKARFGFMETPDVPKVLSLLRGELEEQGHHTTEFKVPDTSFYLGRETLILSRRAMPVDVSVGPMARWRRALFALMSRNAQSATAFFQLPPNRVVELGAQIQF